MVNCTSNGTNYEPCFINGTYKLSLVEEYHIYLYGAVLSKVWFYLSHFIVAFIGPCMSIGIVLYEIFGGDRQKRNIMNQLLSGFIITCFIPNTICSMCKIWLDLFGLIDERIMCCLIAFCYFVVLLGIAFVNELTIIRFMYIVVWKRVKVINDQFWFPVLSVSNVTIPTCTTVMIILTSKSLLHSSLKTFPRLVQTAKIEDVPEGDYERYVQYHPYK